MVARVDAGHGRLDVLVNDIWGAERLIEWNVPIWQHSLEGGLRMMHLGIETHLITSHFALPLLIRKQGGLVVEMTDGTAEYNQANYRLSIFYDLVKTSGSGSPGRSARSWLRTARPPSAHAGVAPLRDDARPLRRERGKLARWRSGSAALRDLREPALRGPGVAALAADPDRGRWNGSSLSSGELATVYGFRDVDGRSPTAGDT